MPNAKIDEKLRLMPSAYRATYRRAMTGESLRAAANSFCLECVAWQREEVKLCTSPACPLYPYRPYKQEAEVNFGEKTTKKGEPVETIMAVLAQHKPRV